MHKLLNVEEIRFPKKIVFLNEKKGFQLDRLNKLTRWIIWIENEIFIFSIFLEKNYLYTYI